MWRSLNLFTPASLIELGVMADQAEVRLSFSEEAARLGVDALESCPALAHAAYQLAFRGGPFADAVRGAVLFVGVQDGGEGRPKSSSSVLSSVATRWAISAASEQNIPSWKVSARGVAFLQDGFDHISTPADWVAAATNYFTETRRKVTKALVENKVGGANDLNKNLKQVLRSGKLVDLRDQLTGEGLRYCLSHPFHQAWVVIIACYAAMEDHQVSRAEVIEMSAVLFQLDHTKAHRFPAHYAPMRNFLGLLASAGLVFLLQKDGERLFIMSPHFSLGIATSGEPISQSSISTGPQKGSIIVETNFRLYLYGTEDLLRDVVLQFASLDVTVSESLTCCRITRASFMNAAQRGIRADQIIEFLTIMAHPVMRRDPSSSVVPQSVCDQLRMWEAEWLRVTSVPDCVVFSGDTQIVLHNLEVLGITPVARSNNTVAITQSDYKLMQSKLR